MMTITQAVTIGVAIVTGTGIVEVIGTQVARIGIRIGKSEKKAFVFIRELFCI